MMDAFVRRIRLSSAWNGKRTPGAKGGGSRGRLETFESQGRLV